jgi:chromosomal replication initiator protein
MQSAANSSVSANDPFLGRVAQLVKPQQFDMWFRRARVRRITDSKYALVLPNSFIRDWVREHYAELLDSALRTTFAADCTLELEIEPTPGLAGDAREGTPTVAMTPPSVAEQDLLASPAPDLRPRLSPNSDTILHREYTFSNFVVGSSNRFAHAAAVAVADMPAKNYNPFFLHGSVGLGKTHLLQAICHEILQRNPATNILYLSCESFINQFIDALENGDLQSFRQKYRNVDVLLVDDIQLLANKDRTQEEFFHTFNTLYNLGHQIVLSSDAPPREIPTLQERLVSRFKMGLVVEIAPPDFETRVNILKTKSRLRGHDLPTDVAHFMAHNILTNIRELEGAVVRLIGYADLEQKELSLPLAQQVVSESAGRRTVVVTIHDIISVVTKHFNVKLSELQSKRRNQSLTFPRQLCMYLARQHTNHSLEEIGGYFGGRDHTTVLYATEKIGTMLTTDPKLADLLRRFSAELDV